MGWFSLSGIRDGKNVELQPKNGQSVGRYFPELIFALKEIKTKKFVLDCEIVLPVQGSFSFDLCCREFTLLKAGSRICLKSILRI
jgi:ATP-dependent DNA ligase